jgi:hypothetical protein
VKNIWKKLFSTTTNNNTIPGQNQIAPMPNDIELEEDLQF